MANRQQNMICRKRKKEKMPEKYENVSLDDFVEYSKSMFEYWTEDDFASSFRKMLTIEQFAVKRCRICISNISWLDLLPM